MSWQRGEWGAADIERLRALAGLGLSSEMIGKQLGRTKNSVIGMARRRGIALTYRQHPPIPEWPPAQLLRSEQQIEQPRPAPGRYGILDLRLGDCRYPTGDRDFTFCGMPQVPDSSYCEKHDALCHNRPHGARLPA